MKFVTSVFNTTVAENYGASSTQFIGAMPQIVTAFRVGFETNISAYTSPAVYQDALARQISSIGLVGGGRNYLTSNITDMRGWYWHIRNMLNGGWRSYDPITGGTGTIYYPLQFLFAADPILPNGKLNRFALDPATYNTANPKIQAAAYNPSIAAGDPDLTFQCTWLANSSMQSSGTYTNGTATLIRLEFDGIIVDTPAQLPGYYPLFGTDQQTPTVQSGLGFQYQLPTGFNYRRTGTLSTVGAGSADVRKMGYGSNSAASQIAIKLYDGTPRLSEYYWDFCRNSQWAFNVADDNSDAPNGSLTAGTSVTAEAANAGVGMIDWRERTRSKSVYGAPLVGKDLGAVNINWTVDVATNASLRYTHQRYLPY